MNNEQRIVVLVPSERDMANEHYRAVYWPNFVSAVQERLRGLDCRIVVSNPFAPPKYEQSEVGAR